jgi:hypothetical protein
MELTLEEGLRIRGRLSLAVLDLDGNVVDRREGDNVMCTTGFTAIAAALVWAGIQDQAGNLGVQSATYLTPLWGAVGSGVGTVAKSDTALFSELGRQTVGAGASTPATGSVAANCTWLFYFPQPASTWTITEAGVFANATSSSGSGSLLDHWSFGSPLTVTTANTAILQASFALGP